MYCIIYNIHVNVVSSEALLGVYSDREEPGSYISTRFYFYFIAV